MNNRRSAFIKSTSVRPGDKILTQINPFVWNSEGTDGDYAKGKLVIDVIGVRWEGRMSMRVDGSVWRTNDEGENERQSISITLFDTDKVTRL